MSQKESRSSNKQAEVAPLPLQLFISAAEPVTIGVDEL